MGKMMQTVPLFGKNKLTGEVKQMGWAKVKEKSLSEKISGMIHKSGKK